MKEQGESSGSDDESYGPALPPYLQNISKKKCNETSDSDEDAYLPALPANLQNRNVKKHENKLCDQITATKEDSDEVDSDEDEMYGPALPPHLMKKQDKVSPMTSAKRIQGPTLPPGFVPPDSLASFSKSEEKEDIDEEDESIGIGPIPSNMAISEKEYRIQKQLELRKQRIKDELDGKFDDNKPVKRETWMLELPEDKPNFCGLAPRQFKRKAPLEKGDRSVWTDTPEDKEKKAQRDPKEEGQVEEITPESMALKLRDDDLTARVDTYNKDKRATSLIDLHKKKLKKNEEKSGPKERKPFSREDDLNVNKFDEAQKSNILKKAQQLNTRFSAGGQKFL